MRAYAHSQCFSHLLVDQIAQKTTFRSLFNALSISYILSPALSNWETLQDNWPDFTYKSTTDPTLPQSRIIKHLNIFGWSGCNLLLWTEHTAPTLNTCCQQPMKSRGHNTGNSIRGWRKVMGISKETVALLRVWHVQLACLWSLIRRSCWEFDPQSLRYIQKSAEASL